MEWLDCGHIVAVLYVGSNVDQVVNLAGWVQNRRDHGGIIFIDLRDREGLTQVTFDPDICSPGPEAQADRLRSEWVISIEGSVKSRGANVNDKMPTGEIEVFASSINVLNKAKPPLPN